MQNEAPPEVVSLIAKADTTALAKSSITKKDKQSLIAMKALIESQLRKLDTVDENSGATPGEQEDSNAREKEKVEDSDVVMGDD